MDRLLSRTGDLHLDRVVSLLPDLMREAPEPRAQGLLAGSPPPATYITLEQFAALTDKIRDIRLVANPGDNASCRVAIRTTDADGGVAHRIDIKESLPFDDKVRAFLEMLGIMAIFERMIPMNTFTTERCTEMARRFAWDFYAAHPYDASMAFLMLIPEGGLPALV